ncbi:sporulation membrane protein YtrI [Thalassorhabdus alkalitolerans]|uniref:Sporulation membrane protein YtrI n=1 Tax=Thalassorhabdus alkalitolerans TaxID=2282697 RepID=A0ABW0YN83_9BACI
MRIPPYYKHPGWQRLFAGFVIGALFGWGFFLYEFGAIHEKLIIDLKKQQLTIEAQQETIEMLRSEEKKLNEENEKKLTIQEILVYFTNEEKIRLSELTLHELRQQIENELKGIKNSDIESVVTNKELMIKTIENKEFLVGEHLYHVKVEQIYMYTTLELHLKILPKNR